MIVVVATLVGIVTAPLSGGRFRRLARLQLHHIWLIWLTIVVQTLIFELPATIVSESVYELVHLATYATSFLFLWLNRHIPGALIIGVGAACNAAAIFANGGVMPASPSAWARAGLAIVPEAQFENSNIVEQAHLAFLGDIFAIPAGMATRKRVQHRRRRDRSRRHIFRPHLVPPCRRRRDRRTRRAGTPDDKNYLPVTD